MNAEATIHNAVLGLVRRRTSDVVELRPDTDLFDELEMDSLEVAELSAILEEELGRDPYSEGIVPRTVGEVVEFYAS